MKFYALALALLITLSLQSTDTDQPNRTPEEAHFHWTNKITNNNSGETTAEIRTQTSVKATVALDKEAYEQLKKQLIEQLKAELKNDPEFILQLAKIISEKLDKQQIPLLFARMSI